MEFTNAEVNIEVLKQRAYNMRWAEVPEGVIPLTAADSDFPAAPEIGQALNDYISGGYFSYTPKLGYPSLREAVAKAMWERKGEKVNPDLVLPIDSAARGMDAIAKTVLEPGDEVIVFDPVDLLFGISMRGCGAKVILYPMKRRADGSIDFSDLEGYITPKTKMLGLCNPHNPLGIVWTEEELRRMMELCLKHHVLVVSDEIHSDLIFHGKRHIPTASLSPEIAANVVTGISATKTFNLAGLQASTAVFPNAHMKAMFDKFWTDMDIHRNNAFSITAMEVAFNEGEEWLEQLLPYISANFDFVVDYCKQHIPKIRTYAPDATYLMWLDCRDLGLSNEALHDFMIQKAKLGLNDGCAFGRSLNGYMRLNVACPRSILEQAMRQLEAAVNSL